MGDPLSTAASVVGLLTAAAQVSQILGGIIKRTRNAPKSCRQLQAEVNDFRNILNQLQSFILGAAQATRSRTSLIMVDQVVVTLTACVTIFSELDVFVDALQGDDKMGLMTKVRWVSKENDLAAIVSKLQLQKTSLGLMLNILTCQKQEDAEDKIDHLCTAVEQTLKQNEVLARRLAAYEAAPVASVPVTQHQTAEASTSVQDAPHLSPKIPELSGPHNSMVESESIVLPAEEASNAPSTELPTPRPPIRGFAFEELLQSSRAYRRLASDNSDTFSVLSSAGRTASWSMLSGLSLSEITNIAILALPIYSADINNEDSYNFEPPGSEIMFSQAADPSSTNTEGSRIPTQPANQKLELRQWWRKYRSQPASHRQQTEPSSIFGKSLTESIRLANVAISLVDDKGVSFIYGYIPIAVAKCVVFLKEYGRDVEDIFAKNGHPARMNALQRTFDNPEQYGKNLNWTGYTVFDAGGLLLRYMKSMPQPVIPHEHYEHFVRILEPWLSKVEPESLILIQVAEIIKIIRRFREAIAALPSLHQQLLLYMLDVLAVFASYEHKNKMSAIRLVSVFQPSLLAPRPEKMNSYQHDLARSTMEFLISTQGHFLIGVTVVPGEEEDVKYSAGRWQWGRFISDVSDQDIAAYQALDPSHSEAAVGV